MFERFQKGTSGRIEEDTEIRELDEFGKPKQKKEPSERGHAAPRGSSSGRGSFKGVLIVGLLVAFIGFLFYTGQTGDFIDMFSSTPEENLTAMLQGVRDVDKINKQEGNLHPIYDTQNIYHSENIFNQVEKQYVVYVYTGDESVDTPFNTWVQNNREDVPIYTLSTWANTDLELDKLIGDDPTFLIIYEHERGYKVLDSVVKDVAKFDTIPDTLEVLKQYRQNKDKVESEQ